MLPTPPTMAAHARATSILLSQSKERNTRDSLPCGSKAPVVAVEVPEEAVEEQKLAAEEPKSTDVRHAWEPADVPPTTA